MAILVTGGCGFIGSNFILGWMEATQESVVNLDKLTYAGNPENLTSVAGSHRYHFERAGIEDTDIVSRLLREHSVRAVINFAAESHVDRSIFGPEPFLQTNVMATGRLLEATRSYWSALDTDAKATFRFFHISTDEVYGTLAPDGPPFTEETSFRPNSPYAASKAASDHLVRSYHETYGLPTLTTNCSNNYGPRHFPEKLIPLVICNALEGKTLPVYGDGQQIRDWLYVDDHCAALREVLARGKPGETYNVGGNSEKRNIEVVRTICETLDDLRPRRNGGSYADQISFVADRPGHDRRYAIDASKIRRRLGWAPAETFETGILKTVRWYLDNPEWVRNVTSGTYRQWIDRQYA